MSSSGAGTRFANGSNTRYYEEPAQVSMSQKHHHQKEPIVIQGEVISPRPLNGATTVMDTTRARPVRQGRSNRRRQTHDRDRRRYYSKDYQQNPSVLHGMWNKFIGAITGNSRRKRHGEREIRHAKRIREALRIAKNLETKDVADPQYGGYSGNKLRKSQRRTFGGGQHHHHHGHQDPVFVSADPAYDSGGPPWMHHHNRTPSPMQGVHHVILGWLTGNKQRRRIGKAMMLAAEEDRRRERESRRNEMREVGHTRDRNRIWTY